MTETNAENRDEKGQYDAVVVGGGFFGCHLALELRRRSCRVLLVEQDTDLMLRASYVNQARVHNGYHYPRHFLTALRSRVNFPRFVDDFEGCIVKDFDKYYAIGRRFSKTTARQFRAFVERFGAPIARASDDIRNLFNPVMIEDVFRVKEYAFDALRLKQIMRGRLEQEGVEILLRHRAEMLHREGAQLALTLSGGQGRTDIQARRIFNCTYANLNCLLNNSNLPLLPLKHEITELCLVQLPEQLRDISVTVMCGPFFSFMPFPPLGLSTLSHVRYTPHCHWYDQPGDYISPYQHLQNYRRRSSFPAMLRDTQRYLPALADCRYHDSLWEVKTTLPASELDDGRPILFAPDHGVPGLTCVMGGKLDNVYDVAQELQGAI
ncbi:MAG: FAD-binding oxidoreductase [Lentisphaerae bacterium]|nr:FAD-binding oxidoreductase [Lentisphaerota bacterium]